MKAKKKPTIEDLEMTIEELEWKIYDLEADLASANRQNHLLWQLFKTMKTELSYE